MLEPIVEPNTLWGYNSSRSHRILVPSLRASVHRDAFFFQLCLIGSVTIGDLTYVFIYDAASLQTYSAFEPSRGVSHTSNTHFLSCRLTGCTWGPHICLSPFKVRYIAAISWWIQVIVTNTSHSLWSARISWEHPLKWVFVCSLHRLSPNFPFPKSAYSTHQSTRTVDS